MKVILVAILTVSIVTPGFAQSASPAAQLGMFPFPAKNQTKDQQASDEKACYDWAGQQTGIDAVAAANPNTEAAAAAAQKQMDSAATGAAVKGAAAGAAGGAIVGAIAGDAGEGAAIGAVAGAVRGRRAKKQAEHQAAQQGAQAAKAQGNAQLETFKKAMGSCLEGKGYTVK
ncbi:MAG TPA: glycine zipper domain-containing protein [Gemmatimonadales bacterium]|nr:glycine zipper domain-containing protein [Gemmatimonadales bacterium]